jgi:threonine/homoserine/homoserine lactone efflux protein
MSLETALVAYVAAAALLTITPGLDTALVLRTLVVEGPRRAMVAASGIVSGVLVWGLGVALGLGVLLAASQLAYDLLRWAGAAYLAWLGLNLIFRPRTRFELATAANAPGRANWWLRGLLTNLLNPKVGVFYVSFLPQFVPAHVAAAPFMVLLAAIHAGLGLAWFAILVGASGPLRRAIERPAVVRWLDRATGAVFLGFGARLALARR